MIMVSCRIVFLISFSATGNTLKKAVPSEILENISLYCLIILANFHNWMQRPANENAAGLRRICTRSDQPKLERNNRNVTTM